MSLLNKLVLRQGGGSTLAAAGDVTAPALSSATDTVTGSTTATIGVTTDTAEGTLYGVVSTSATPPSKAQVKAGQDHTGAAAAFADSQAVASTGAKTFSATGLTAATAYFAHFMHEDASANQSDVASGDGFTTYTAEAQAVFDAFTTPADATRKGHINTLVGALKTAGVWALTDNLYVLAAAAADQALINWKSPGTFALTAVNSPAFVADQGYTSDGSTSYLDSAWDPGTNGVQYTQDSAHIGAYARTAGTAAVNDVGNGTGITDGARARSGNPGRAYVNSTTAAGAGSAVVTPPLHVVGIRRVSTDVLTWRDGSQSNTTAAASSAPSTVDINICRANSAFSDRQIAAAHWGAALDDTEAAAYYTALHTYMVAVGADS